jgi:hypothetical protein
MTNTLDQSNRKPHSAEEIREKRSKGMKAAWNKPGARDSWASNQRIGALKRWSNPEERKKQSQTMAVVYADKGMHERISVAMRAVFARKRAVKAAAEAEAAEAAAKAAKAAARAPTKEERRATRAAARVSAAEARRLKT